MSPPETSGSRIDGRRLLISPILESPAPFLMTMGMLRLIEPAGADRLELIKAILAGNHVQPFVIDDGRKLCLHFSLAHVQSAMLRKDPFALVLAYTRKMMAFRLFVPDPRRILIVGLGGGSLAKYCYRHLPGATITAVEINPQVIAFREQFAIPPDDRRFRIVEADAVDYLANGAESADAILLDGYDRHGITPAFRERDFYLDLRRRLTTAGVLVANLSGKNADYQAHLELIREVFENQVLVLDVAGTNNRVVFAFNAEDYPRRFDGLGSGKPN